MSGWIRATTALLAAALSATACGGKGTTPGAPSAGDVSGGTDGAGGAEDGAGGAGGMAGENGGAGGAPAGCGDGVIQPGEACDGAALGGKTCADVQGQMGMLACTSDCKLDTSKCGGPEQCTDNEDNDKDGKTDCADPDCASSCADPCGSAVMLADGATMAGTTTGHVNKQDALCSSTQGSGPEVVYQFIAVKTGVLDLALNSASANLGLSVRTSCGDSMSEIGCADRAAGEDATERLKIAVTQGQPVFVVVQGFTTTDAGAFTLSAKNRAVTCGDGHADGGEGCDDGNTTSGDGCSATCKLEATEVEPNDTTVEANAYTAPFYGAIAVKGDLDVVRVGVGTAGATLSAAVTDLDGKSCLFGLLDSFVEILDASATTLTAADGGGVGTCSLAKATGLAVGTYYVRVSASFAAPSPTFPYALKITVQ
jgi:cysteine-rich repeat protein